MFRLPVPQNTRGARPNVGQITPIAIPAKGMNARDPLSMMSPDTAIVLNNVLCDPYGLKTRKGYTEWATNLPLGVLAVTPVATMMSYYPAIAAPAALNLAMHSRSMMRRMVVEPALAKTPPAGKLFAARGGFIYDVTAGGPGPWVAQAGVTGGSDYWTWINFQNIAGAFLLACTWAGGYAIYDGAAWAMPTMGGGVGQIANVDPAKFVFVQEHKKRLWFIEKDSTKAWYLPVGQITGAATMFNFGEQFRAGGHLVALASWTVDGGIGVDDYLIAVSSQGDVVVYKGTDPNSAVDWAITGVWHVGPLPVGRRSVFNTGADVHILSQFGVTPVSLLLKATALGAMEQQRVTYMIGPLIARLMRQYGDLDGWQIRTLPSEEILVIGVPRAAQEYGGQFFAQKYPSSGWSLLTDVPYASFVNIDAAIYAGTIDGRVVRAFDGPVDNVTLVNPGGGLAIRCLVMPAFQALGVPGVQKRVMLVRPTFLTTVTPTLALAILTDYGPAPPPSIPALPATDEAYWDEDLWDVAKWSGLQSPIHDWLGCKGVGFTATVQFTYKCGGDTILTSIDFWTEQGGVM